MLEDAPLLTIRRGFARPDPAQVRALEGALTSQIVDAMGGRGALDYRIKPLPGGRERFCGTAITCHTGPADNLALCAAVAEAKPGDVLVCATDGFLATSVIGDLLLGMARNRGCAALVTDGLVRDLEGLLAVGMPVFSRGLTPNSPARNGPGTVGLAVTLGGATVEAGDVLVGDRDGVAVVPRRALAATIEQLRQVQTAEQAMETKVKDGLEVPDFIDALLASPRVRYLE